MAVDFDKLKTSLVIQDVFVDQTLPDTVSQVAAGARVFFYKTDKITPKNIYIQTFDPMNPYIVGANPQVTNTAGRLEQKIFFYFFDEDDDEPTNEELYYIEVLNQDNVIIDAKEDFVPNQTEGGGSTTLSTTNLSPSYGFDIIDRNNLENPQYAYNSPQGIFISEQWVYPALGFVWVIEAPTNGDFYYEYTNVTIGTLEGDPRNYINLIQENFGSSQTNCFFGFPICLAEELIGSTLTFQFIAQDQSTAPVSSLDVGIIRAPNVGISNLIEWGNASIPINVGSVSLDTSLSTRTISFEMPDIVTSPQDGSQSYLTIGLPLDQNFNIALTGFYVYQGQDVVLTILKDNMGNRYSRALGQAMNAYLTSSGNNFTSINQPIIRSQEQGAFNFQDRTGILFQRAVDQTAQNTNFAILATGQNVVTSYSYLEGGGQNILSLQRGYDLLGDRYLEKYSSNLGRLGDNSFITSNITAISLQVRTVLQHASFSGWLSNSGVLVITPISGPSQHIITAAVDGGIPERVNLTFTQNYTAITWGYKTQPQDFTYNTFPPQSPLVNWFGSIVSGIPPFLNNFNPTPGIAQGVINPGSGGAPAEAFIQFPGGGLIASLIRTGTYIPPSGPVPYQNLNCLEFLNPASAGAPQLPLKPPYAIQFKVDGVGDNIPVSDTIVTVNLPSSQLGTGANIASAMTAIINSATEYILTYSGIPNNGESFIFSSTYKEFIAIFWITNQAQPINPIPSNPAVYILIAPGASIQDVVNTTNQVLSNSISSIPTAADLNITLGHDLALWMEA